MQEALVRLPAWDSVRLHLDVQLQQGRKAVDQHKRLALLICILDSHVGCQLAVGTPAELAPGDVAKGEHNYL